MVHSPTSQISNPSITRETSSYFTIEHNHHLEFKGGDTLTKSTSYSVLSPPTSVGRSMMGMMKMMMMKRDSRDARRETRDGDGLCEHITVNRFALQDFHLNTSGVLSRIREEEGIFVRKSQTSKGQGVYMALFTGYKFFCATHRSYPISSYLDFPEEHRGEPAGPVPHEGDL